MINTGLTVRRLITTGYHYSKLPVYKSTKHGTIALFIPGHDPPIDLTVFSDVAVNPGPEPAISQANSNNSTLAIKISTSDLHTSNQVQSTPLQYSRDQLKCLRHVHNSVIDTDLYHNLKAIGLFRYRGRRAGKCVKDCSSVDERSIPVKPPTRPENQSLPKVTANLHNVINIPSFLICNARSLAPKVDELECVALQNHVDIIGVTETWLSDEISESAVAMGDYMLFRKDRLSRGGGVAAYVNSKIPCKRLTEFENSDPSIESLWLQLRPRRLPRKVSVILLAVIYHPPQSTVADNEKLVIHIQRNVDSYLRGHPDSLVCVLGDFNPNSTNISPITIKRMCGLIQTVKVFTRDSGILDWCLTNSPKLMSAPKQLPKIGSSDHYCVLIEPCLPKDHIKVPRPTTFIRDSRDSCIREFGRWMTSFSWHDLYQLDSCKDKFEYFHHTLSGAVDRFLPTKVSCIHASDKPWMNSKIKSWIAKRQKCLARYGKDSSLFKLWRNRVQQSIKSSKKSFYSSKVKSLKNSNISKWWKAIKSLSGSSLTEGQWYNQLIDGTSIVSLQSLCDKINDFFVGLTADFVPLTHTDVTNIIVYDQQIPEDLLVSTNEAYKALSSIKTKKAPGPDGIPNTVLKLFAYELAPVVANMYNSSLREGFIPPLLKSAAVCPLPKQRPPSSIENDIRPISLTCQIAKVFEGFTLSRILPSILDKLDNNQFAVQGKSTDQALVYLLHLALEALDRGNCSIRLFFADFRKGFDLIDHVILLDKLTKYNCHNCLVRWIAAFLQGRTQFVRLASVCSSSQALNGGIPQGTKLGPILFAVMVNDLISTWRPRAKFVDDLTALEIIPRNSPSIMQFIVDDVQSFSSDNNMKLNPLKCKEMFIDFLHYNSCELQPIVTNGTFIERVKSFKLLGVFISDDLTWAAHCDFVIKKANRRLYALRQLKKAGVPASDIITIYCTLIRSVIEYASVVFASLPSYLSNSLESIQKRALSIIFPGSSYSESLDKSGLPTLVDRRVLICRKFVSSIPSGNPIHPLIHKRVVPSSSSLSLRSGQTHRPMLVKTERFKNFVTVKFQDSRLS